MWQIMHWLDGMARVKACYNRDALLVNENDSAALGLVGSAGFLLLLGRLVLPRKPSLALRACGVSAPGPLWEGLAVLNLGAVLLAVRGGLSGLIAMQFTWIRGYNRISVFIGFFALFAVVLLLEQLRGRVRSARANTLAYAALDSGSFGILDLTTGVYSALGNSGQVLGAGIGAAGHHFCFPGPQPARCALQGDGRFCDQRRQHDQA